jgi:hypothetical protein
MSDTPAIIPPERVVEHTAHMGVAGYFEVELIHKPTGLVKQKLRFRNLITDAGLNWIGAGSGVTQGAGIRFGSDAWMAVGSGSTAPAVTDTTLVAQSARTNSRGTPEIPVSAGSADDFDYWWIRTTKVFAPGVATGNLTEVGLFETSVGGTLFARQLFRDNTGTPITIIKTADDELRITYELRLYTMKVSNVNTLTVKSESRTCTTRGYDIDLAGRWGNTVVTSQALLNYLGTTWQTSYTSLNGTFISSSMPALTATQVGTRTSFSAGGWVSGYIGSSYYKDYSATMNPGVGNLTIGSVIWGGNNPFPEPPFITTIDPPILKTDTERFTFVGRFSWGRV